MSERTTDPPRLVSLSLVETRYEPRLAPLARLHEEVAARVRGVCRDMPPDRFDALVREIVRVKLKYDTPPVRSRDR